MYPRFHVCRRLPKALTPTTTGQRPLTRSLSAHPGNLTHSSVTGPLSPPLYDSTLYSYFTSQVLAKHPSRPALICRAERSGAHGGPTARIRNLAKEGGGERAYLAWDFEEFDRNIMALARGLVGLGVKKGDRVGVVMGNNRYARSTRWDCEELIPLV